MEFTSLGVKQPVKFYDPANPTNSFSPQINPVSLPFTPGNVRKYVMTTNGTSIISGDREYPPLEIKITWDQLDYSDYQSLVPFTAISPIVFCDNNNHGFLGVLVIDKAGQVVGKTKNIWAVEAAFLVLGPYNGVTGALNTLATPIINYAPDAATLSNWTLSGLTLSTGGPSGAADAEYTGTGTAVGSYPVLTRTIDVVMGQTYITSFWIDPSAITNNTGSEYHGYLYSTDNLAGTHDTYWSGTSAGRYSLPSWLCPTNIARNSDTLSTWGVGNGMVLGTGGPSGTNDFEFAGTGASSSAYAQDSSFPVTPGVTYTFSVNTYATNFSGGNPHIKIYDAANASYTTQIVSGAAGWSRVAVTWTAPANATTINLTIALDGITVPSGTTMKFANPMLEESSSMAGYYISSEKPQIQISAGIVSSTIVTSGQKFKISQPMLSSDSSTSFINSTVSISSTGGYMTHGKTSYVWFSVFTPWGESTPSPAIPIAIPSSPTNDTYYATLSWTQPSSSYFSKIRLYWNTTDSFSSATFLTEVQAGQTGTFPLYSDYVQYSPATPATYNTAFTGYWAGAIWQQGS